MNRRQRRLFDKLVDPAVKRYIKNLEARCRRLDAKVVMLRQQLDLLGPSLNSIATYLGYQDGWKKHRIKRNEWWR